MREKTARRFLARNKWKIAQYRAGVSTGTPPSWVRRYHKARSVEVPLFFDFSVLRDRLAKVLTSVAT
jgi:hypothetical protein